ncbi:ALP1-like protein [Tanacetum coccineum]
MNPFFPMNQNNDDDEERQPTVFKIDEETDVYFLEQAYAYHQQLVAEENRPRLTRNPINRDRERTARDCLFHFNKCIISVYMTEYLRKPTLEDVENIYNKHLTTHGRHGFPGFGVAGANNDINVLDNSQLFDDLINDTAHVLPYVVNGVGYEKGYYLADGIYPLLASKY